MNILSADTSTSVMYLTLRKGDEYFCIQEDDSMKHSETLVPSILKLLKEHDMKITDLDLLSCTSGPGSFTGLRIAMSALKGISVATDIPLVSVSSTELWANTVKADHVIVAIDAKKKRYYTSIFDGGKRTSNDLDCDEVTVAKLIEGYDEVTVTGPDAEAFAQKLGKVTDIRLVVETHTDRLGRTLSDLALAKFERDGADDIGTGPVYVRKSDAEIALEEKIRSMEA